jgi:hypothetical protein
LISRRFFLKAGLLVPVAPAIVKAESIMCVKSLPADYLSVYSGAIWDGNPLVFDKAHTSRTIEVVRGYLSRGVLPPETSEIGKVVKQGSGKRVAVWSQPCGGFTLGSGNPSTMPIMSHNGQIIFFKKIDCYNRVLKAG